MKLEGLRVLDLTSFLPGPYLTLALADHGAQVTKIEAPGGDHGRAIGPHQDDTSIFFRNLNRGKTSIVINLKDAADRQRFLELADTADVVVESSRPGVAARLGVDYATLSARNPRLVYCSITAFGQDGPLAKRPAHDLALEAMAGVVANTISAAGDVALPAIPAADYLSGLQGLAGVMMALYRREQTGKGDFIDISMLEAMVSATVNVIGPALADGSQPDPRTQRTTGGSAFYRLYTTADNRSIALAGQERKFVTALLGSIGRADLVPLCAAPGPHQAPVVTVLTDLFAGLTLAEAGTMLDGLGLCWGPVQTYPEALDDPHLAHRNFVLRDEHGRRHIGPVIRFSDEPAQPDLAAPALGEH